MSSLHATILSIFILVFFSCWELIKPLHQYTFEIPWFKRLLILAAVGIGVTTAIRLFITPYLLLISPTPIFANIFLLPPKWLNGLIAYLCITFFVYWWHRYRHYSNGAWRFFHQIHHSTHRLQALTALYANPADFAVNIVIINVVGYCILGMDTQSVNWATLWVFIFECWEHTNIRTPRWLGFFIARPEMHRIHHERDRHSNNYGLPIWDMIFGTYENSSRPVECGFHPQDEEKLGQMLACKQVQ